jgi:hypothetical protein
LKPSPARRLRGAGPHLLHSIAVKYLSIFTTFVAHFWTVY